MIEEIVEKDQEITGTDLETVETDLETAETDRRCRRVRRCRRIHRGDFRGSDEPLLICMADL
jgi:hypothetical protein